MNYRNIEIVPTWPRFICLIFLQLTLFLTAAQAKDETILDELLKVREVEIDSTDVNSSECPKDLIIFTEKYKDQEPYVNIRTANTYDVDIEGYFLVKDINKGIIRESDYNYEWDVFNKSTVEIIVKREIFYLKKTYKSRNGFIGVIGGFPAFVLNVDRKSELKIFKTNNKYFMTYIETDIDKDPPYPTYKTPIVLNCTYISKQGAL